MSLIRFEKVSLAFGEAPLLDEVDLQIDPRERIFLVGRNGMGKSCLLKLILGQLQPDGGKIYRREGLKITELSQQFQDWGDKTVYEVVAEGLSEVGELLKNYHHLSHHPDLPSPQIWLNSIEKIQKQLDAIQGWQYSNAIDRILSRLELPADQLMHSLSGGWKRRVELAKALVGEPDLLLLDEPTNHLDLEAILWLEEFLKDFPGALLVVTHDRALLQNVAQQIWDLDRGKLWFFSGKYEAFLLDKEHRSVVEKKQAKLFDVVLAKEEAWIRQGIKARRTRNEGRVRALKALREDHKKRRQIQSKPKFNSNEVLISGDLVIQAEDISFSIGDKYLVRNFTTNIFRGDKIALIGPNGVGKTTLLKLLLGELKPTEGNVKLGTGLHIGYFDQLRSKIDFSLSACENVGEGREVISINGVNKHIMSYLSDFLFTPDRARTPVKMLSGGECNRLLLAKLFSLPVNLLVLDEPTNDLDIETLELLEEILIDFKGTILLVSHDRAFVDAVATDTFYFEGNGKIDEYVGGYRDIPKEILNRTKSQYITADSYSHSQTELTAAHRKSTYTKPFSSRYKRELEELPNKISNTEEKLQVIQKIISDPAFYSKEKLFITDTLMQLKQMEQDLNKLYKRWEELETLKNESQD